MSQFIGENLPPNPADALLLIYKEKGCEHLIDKEAFDIWRAYCEENMLTTLPYTEPFSSLVDIIAWTAQCGEAYVIVSDGLCKIFVDIKKAFKS